MKYLIVSDNHGDRDVLVELKEKYEGSVDYFIHCGDSLLDHTDPLWETFLPVQGNSDYDQHYPIYQLFETEDGRFFSTHGHYFHVKRDLSELMAKGHEENIDVLIYGHTHVIDYHEKEGLLVINPGSISYPRGYYLHRTYCILDIEKGHKTVTFYNRNHEPLETAKLPFAY